GQRFKGVYNMWEKNLQLISGQNKSKIEAPISFADLNDSQLEKHIGTEEAATLREEVELITEVYPSFDRDAYLNGELSPVFFGSALNNFGVRELLDCFVQIAPPPQPKKAEERLVRPEEEKFSGFVFKIHAN